MIFFEMIIFYADFEGKFGTRILIFVCICILAQIYSMFEMRIYILLFMCIYIWFNTIHILIIS